MILCLDIGNSHIYGGVLNQQEVCLQFRYPTLQSCTSDQLGVFFRTILRENAIDWKTIQRVGICSVVPSIDYSVRSAIIKYFQQEPFVLALGIKTGLLIKYRQPAEVGSDRIANALAAVTQFPKKNLIVIDFGSATTFDVVTEKKEYLGGVIMPGMQMAMDALHRNTEKLPPTRILKPKRLIGQTTAENIQAGLYYGQLGALREVMRGIQKECFEDKPPIIVGTGGFAHLFKGEGLFTTLVPELVLQGIRVSLEKNDG